MMRLYVAAFEPSGDIIGAEFIEAFRQIMPEAEIMGIGGEAMAARGVVSPFDIAGLSVVGLTEALSVAMKAWRCVQAVVADIEASQPDAVILIDSWSLTSWIARRLKKRGSRARQIKLIGPQIWATRAGRAKVAARLFEHIFCIYEMERVKYRPHGLAATTIGHPATGRFDKGDGTRFRQRYGLDRQAPVIGLLLGSRRSEVRQIAPVLERVAHRLCKEDSQRRIVCFVAPSVAALVRKRAMRWRFPALLIEAEEDKADAFAAMDLALVCMGTVMFELVAQQTPLVSVYRIGWLGSFVARFVICTRYLTLLNAVADREIIPEFVQGRMRVRSVAVAAERLLSDKRAVREQIAAQNQALTDMGGRGLRGGGDLRGGRDLRGGDALPMQIAAEKTAEILKKPLDQSTGH